MMPPNWFDQLYDSQLSQATPQQAIEIVAQDAKLLAAVTAALHAFDTQPARPGPSRTQVIRTTIANVLGAQSE